MARHDVLMTASFIQELHKSAEYVEFFDSSLATYFKKSDFATLKEQIDWIRCVSILRLYFPNLVKTETLIEHCKSIDPPTYIVANTADPRSLTIAK